MSGLKFSQDMKHEIAEARLRLSPFIRMNFRVAGALADVNRLIGRGWTDLTGGREGGGEYYRIGSAWLEYVGKDGADEYHVTLSVGCTLKGMNEREDGMCGADPEYMERAHRGEVPRVVFLRRVSVYKLDAGEFMFKLYTGKVPFPIVEKVEADLAAAVLEPPRLLVEDLHWQTRGFDHPEDGSSASATDLELLKLDSVLSRAERNGDRESVVRLLMPIVQAVMTEEDPEGRAFLAEIGNPHCLASLASHAVRSGVPEMVAAIFALLFSLGADKVEAAFDFDTWHALAVGALSLELPHCAAAAMGEVAKRRQPEDEEQLRQMERLLQSVDAYLKTEPRDAYGIRAVVGAVDGFGEPLADDSDTRLLVAVGKCLADKIAGRPMEGAIEELGKVVAKCLAEFDSIQKDGHGTDLLMLPPGVKAPLAWQAYVFCRYGAPEVVIDAFPRPPLEMATALRNCPSMQPIEGLSPVDIWSGFMPGDREFSRELFEDRMKTWRAGLVKEGDVHELLPFEQGLTGPGLRGYQLMTPSDADAAELMTMCQDAVFDADSRADFSATFPNITAKGRPGKGGGVVRFWKYYPWAYFQAADAEFALASGRHLTAVMPFFAGDRWSVARGAPCEVTIAGFAHSLAKKEVPSPPDPVKINGGLFADGNDGPVEVRCDARLFDFFDQDNIDGHFSRSGFGLQGRIRSLRRIQALGTEVAVVTVECAQLDEKEFAEGLDIYIGADRVDAGLKPGDTVEAYGWMYVDIRHLVGTPDDYLASWPFGIPLDDPKEDHLGVPLYVREDFNVGRNWPKLALAALRSVEGVKRVAMGSRNPQLVDYLVEKDGKILKYTFTLGGKEGKTGPKIQDMHRIILSEERTDQGKKLTWNIE